MHQTHRHYNISGHVVQLKPAWVPEPGYVPTYYFDMRKEAAYLAMISVIFTYVNIICLYIMCVLTLKLKERVPLGLRLDDKERQFFHEHLAAYRNQ